MTVPVAIVHDYLTQRGGAERVVLAMLEAFPSAPVYTALYNPDQTFPEFGGADIRTGPLNRVAMFRRNHRSALPFLAPAFSSTKVEADLALCSTSGWGHGARVSGRRVVYCHSPARWLYQTERYLGGAQPMIGATLDVLKPALLRWDRAAASAPGRWLTNSTEVRGRIKAVYGRDAELVPPPFAVDPEGTQRPVAGVEPGFFLTVSRLLPYKNVTAMVDAFATLREHRLIVVGTGPDRKQVERAAGANVALLGTVDDDQLRWLYANSGGLLAASYEDYGLTPLEGAAFGKPVAALRGGGFLDTVKEDVTGVFFDRPEAAQIADAVTRLVSQNWDRDKLRAHADEFSKSTFIQTLHRIAAEERALGSGPRSR